MLHIQLSRSLVTEVGRSRFLHAAIFSAVFSLVLIGCAESTNPDNGNPSAGTMVDSPFPWEKTSGNPQGIIYATAQTAGTSDPLYISGAQIFTSSSMTPPVVDAGTATASGLAMSFASGEGYVSVDAPVFGSTTSWGLSGNAGTGILSFSESMYMPAIVHLTSPVAATTAISKSAGVTVQWNADPGNSDVILGFKYDVSTSQFVDPNLPQFEYSWYIVAPDNGSYTIPASAFSTLPVGGYVDLVVTRGNGKMSGPSSQDVYIYGYSVSSGLFKISS